MIDGAGTSTDSLEQIVNQFKEFCDVDSNVARIFLKKSSWNLEDAIHQYFQKLENNSLNDKQNNELQSKKNTPKNSLISNLANKNSNSVQINNDRWSFKSGLLRLLRFIRHYFITVPLQLFFSSILHAFTFLSYLMGETRLAITDPRADIRHFIDEIVNKQANQDKVTFFNGSYEDALKRAKQNIQCLVVYLHSSSPECNSFLQTHILTNRFRNLIQTNDALLWGASTQTGEGKRVAISLRVISYPAVAIITCVTGGSMACIFRMSDNNMLHGDRVFNALQSAFDENLPHLRPLLNEKANREINSQLIREQEIEYANSLAADRAKLEKKLRIEAEENEKKRLEKEEIDRIQRKKESLNEIRERIRFQLPTQPQPINSETSSSIVCVRIKFPNGQTITWNFDAMASLEELFNVVFVHECCPDNFSLLTGYPAQTLNCAPKWYHQYSSNVDSTTLIPTFEGADFGKSAVVLVRDNDA